MLTPTTHPTPHRNWTDSCDQCGAVIVGVWPGDVKLAQAAQGWTNARCPGCSRKATNR